MRTPHWYWHFLLSHCCPDWRVSMCVCVCVRVAVGTSSLRTYSWTEKVTSRSLISELLDSSPTMVTSCRGLWIHFTHSQLNIESVLYWVYHLYIRGSDGRGVPSIKTYYILLAWEWHTRQHYRDCVVGSGSVSKLTKHIQTTPALPNIQYLPSFCIL